MIIKNKRMTDLYKKVYSDEALTEAWHRVRQGSKTAGVDGISVVQFQRRLFSNLKSIQDELKGGSFQPDPVKRFRIAKQGGGFRQLGILTVRDRVAQAAVFHVIEPLFEADFEASSYAYRPGRNVHMALRNVRRITQGNHKWILDIDIKQCFDSIPLHRLSRLLKGRLKDRRLHKLMQRWMMLQALHVEEQRRFRGWKAFGLIQGGCLSPLLSNIYLDQVDKALRAHHLKSVRYADDILICCQSRKRAHSALQRAKRILTKLDLTLNEDKTRVEKASESFQFLGQTLASIEANSLGDTDEIADEELHVTSEYYDFTPDYDESDVEFEEELEEIS